MRRPLPKRDLLLVLLAVLGSVIAMNWTLIGVGLTAVTAAITAWVHFGRPWWRERKRRSPCEAHFVIRDEKKTKQPYVVQDDDTHLLRTLALPPNSTQEVEIGYRAGVHFKLVELVVGCDGAPEARPFVDAIYDRYTNVPIPPEAQAADMHGFYHWKREVLRNVGTHYVFTVRLNTRQPGIYPFLLSFITDEIEGNCALSIVVEEKPRTRMKCIHQKHRRCYVRPIREAHS